MSCEEALRVHNLGKAYRLYSRPQDRLKQILLGRWREYGRAFWALRGVSFSVCKGEMLAIIGRNGSGKSTLLQLIAGTLQPSEGDINVDGRIAALLELGSGFHPEFTGRENIYVNGAILGLTQREIEDKIDDIIAFADIGDFIDQPVKYYSSGMFVRLAFAVTTGLDPDILLVDEALAVGDVFFKQKCYRQLEKLLERGTAVVLVTHNMGDVEMFAHKAILLQRGKVYYQGTPTEAVRQYFLLEQEMQEARLKAHLHQGALSTSADVCQNVPAEEETIWKLLTALPREGQVGNGKAICTGLLLTDDEGQPRQVFRQGDELHVYYEFEVMEDLLVPIGALAIRNAKDVFVHGRSALETASDLPLHVPKGSRLRYHQSVTLGVEPGEYSLEVGLAEILPEIYAQREFLSPSELRQGLVRVCHAPTAAQFIVTLRSYGSPSVLTHRGLCDLPGEMELQVFPPMEQQYDV